MNKKKQEIEQYKLDKYNVTINGLSDKSLPEPLHHTHTHNIYLQNILCEFYMSKEVLRIIISCEETFINFTMRLKIRKV